MRLILWIAVLCLFASCRKHVDNDPTKDFIPRKFVQVHVSDASGKNLLGPDGRYKNYEITFIAPKEDTLISYSGFANTAKGISLHLLYFKPVDDMAHNYTDLLFNYKAYINFKGDVDTFGVQKSYGDSVQIYWNRVLKNTVLFADTAEAGIMIIK